MSTEFFLGFTASGVSVMRQRSTTAAQGRQEPCRRRSAAIPAIVAIAALAALLAAIPVLAGTNLLANSEFSNFTVAPWVGSAGTLLLSNLDHSSNPNSGSARLVHPSGTIIASSMFSEKVAVAGGVKVTISGYFRTAGSTPAGAKVQLQMRYYSDTACASYITPPFPNPYKSGWLSLTGSWAAQAFSHTSPSNARCGQMQIDTTDLTDPYGAFDLLADGLSLLTPVDPLPNAVFQSGFENGTTDGWIVFP